MCAGRRASSWKQIFSAKAAGACAPRKCCAKARASWSRKAREAIEIGRLQRFAVDHVLDRNIRLFQAGAPNGRRVACIGSGPASLACAARLARKGYSVTVFDRRELAGGLNTYGIAAYKTRVADSLREVEMVKSLGVEFRQKVEIGRDISFEQLEKDFDAIFIGVGLGETWAMDIPGEDLHGVCGALEFIEPTKVAAIFARRHWPARRLHRRGEHGDRCGHRRAPPGRGGRVPVYRRSEQEMSAFRYEYELAKKDGVNFLWQTQPVRILGSGGVVTGLECVRTRLGEPDARGKRAPETIPNSTFTIDVDMVVRAVGQKQATDFLRAVKGIEVRKNGTVADGRAAPHRQREIFCGRRLRERRQGSCGRRRGRHGGGAGNRRVAGAHVGRATTARGELSSSWKFPHRSANDFRFSMRSRKTGNRFRAPRFIGWLSFYVVLLGNALFGGHLFQWFDLVFIPIHEGGHLLFRFFGEWIMVAGGTFLQLFVPFALAVYFAFRRQVPGTAFCAFFFFEQFLPIAIYMADARARTCRY